MRSCLLQSKRPHPSPIPARAKLCEGPETRIAHDFVVIMRSFLSLLFVGSFLLLAQTGCRTAGDAAATGLDAGAHVADKTGRVLEHGARKVDNNF